MPLLNEPKGLASLPNEILLEIFLEKVLTQTDLFSLALVSRRFSRLVPVSLYNTVQCNLEHEIATNEITHTHAELRFLVREVILYLGGSGRTTAAVFLESLPALRSLYLTKTAALWERIPNIFDVPMIMLRSADFGMIYLNAEDVVRFMLLPNIRSLKGTLRTRATDPVIELEGLAGRSSLKSLELYGNEPHMAMRELLALAEALEHFSFDASCRTSAQLLSPKEMSCALTPTWPTLQNLTVLGYELWEERVVETDDSLMDLSCFTSLKSLTILHIYCLQSGNSTPLSERHDLYRRLPSSLEKLEVCGQ